MYSLLPGSAAKSMKSIIVNTIKNVYLLNKKFLFLQCIDLFLYLALGTSCVLLFLFTAIHLD